jgi:tRNA A37 N6-isopentenylltransferase MiaA
MTDDEIQLKAQSSLQEYDDAVENLAANFAELGQKAIAALEEFISYWNRRPEAAEADSANKQANDDMRKFVERQLEWAQHEKQRVIAQLPKGTVSGKGAR